jgi:hypothetical protein
VAEGAAAGLGASEVIGLAVATGVIAAVAGAVAVGAAKGAESTVGEGVCANVLQARASEQKHVKRIVFIIFLWQ